MTGQLLDVHTLLLVPYFRVGAFVFDTFGKWEHHSPEGNGDVSRKSHSAAGPAAQGMKPGRTRESASVGGRGSTRGLHHPLGDNPPVLSRQKSLFHCNTEKYPQDDLFGVVLDHSTLCVEAVEIFPW